MALEAMWLAALITAVVADYACVCNYNKEASVRQAPRTTAHTISYMYEYDCKQNIPVTNLHKTWLAVAYEHQVGYVQLGTNVLLQKCYGSPQVDDLVTFKPARITQPTATETITTTTRIAATSSSPITSTLFSTATTHAKPTTTTTKIPITTSQRPTTTPPTKTTTSRTTTATLRPPSTTPKPTTTIHLMTQKPTTRSTTTAPTPAASENTNICRSVNRQHSYVHHTILAQHGSSCYELMPQHQMNWYQGEQLCKSAGGHLAHIGNHDEQAFIQGFVQRYLPNRPVWIGLHDIYREGYYQWTSGNAVQYTNFIHDHLGNIANRRSENCFIFIPFKKGQWDDISCGNANGYAGYGDLYPVLCQFPVTTSSFIG